MAKYVCDFSKVNEIANNIIKSSDEMKASIDKYSSTLESSMLSQWSGVAKDSFDKANKNYVDCLIASSKSIEALGNFIKESSDAISAAESELSSLTI